MFQQSRLYSSVAQSSTSLCPKFHYELVYIGVSNQSRNKGGVKIECHNCFNILARKHSVHRRRTRRKKETHGVRFFRLVYPFLVYKSPPVTS